MVVRRSALQRSGDKNAPQALFKPICVQYGFGFFVTEKSKSVSSAAGRPGFQGAALNRFCILLSAQKDAPAGQACLLKPRKRPAPPEVTAIYHLKRPTAPTPQNPPRFPRKSPRKGLTSGRHLCYDVITSRRRAFFSCAFLAFGPLLFPHGRAADHFSPQRGRQKKSEV